MEVKHGLTRTNHSESVADPRGIDAMERYGIGAQDSVGQMAGALGFEPRNDDTKNRCLTTWRRPSMKGAFDSARTALYGGLATVSSPNSSRCLTNLLRLHTHETCVAN